MKERQEEDRVYEGCRRGGGSGKEKGGEDFGADLKHVRVSAMKEVTVDGSVLPVSKGWKSP